MLYLVITMCMGTPEVCKDVAKPTLDPDLTIMQCLIQASIQIEQIMRNYPGWRATAWTCTYQPKPQHGT